MKILVVVATPFEIAPLQLFLDEHFSEKAPSIFTKQELTIEVLITGVGLVATTFYLTHRLTNNRYDLVLNLGVAGAFDRSLKLGEVVNVISEQFGDLGVEEADGSFTDMVELGLIDRNESPFINGKLYNSTLEGFDFLKKVKGLTVHKVHGNTESINAISKKYQVEVESMEGAAFYYTCLLAKVPFMEIRSISNYVESRNRDNWELGLAIDNLNKVMLEIVKLLETDAVL